MARVPKDRIRERGAYEFFVRLDDAGRPVWTRDKNERGAVFEHAGHCNRSGTDAKTLMRDRDAGPNWIAECVTVACPATPTGRGDCTRA